VSKPIGTYYGKVISDEMSKEELLKIIQFLADDMQYTKDMAIQQAKTFSDFFKRGMEC